MVCLCATLFGATQYTSCTKGFKTQQYNVILHFFNQKNLFHILSSIERMQFFAKKEICYVLCWYFCLIASTDVLLMLQMSLSIQPQQKKTTENLFTSRAAARSYFSFFFLFLGRRLLCWLLMEGDNFLSNVLLNLL